MEVEVEGERGEREEKERVYTYIQNLGTPSLSLSWQLCCRQSPFDIMVAWGEGGERGDEC